MTNDSQRDAAVTVRTSHHHSTDVPPSEFPKSWHPKITPFRLAVLTTTIGLGTAKTVVTQKGGTIVSTTLEWVAGTALSVIFLCLGAYESAEEDNVPSYLAWLFKPDCVDLIWRFLALFAIERPEYTSEEVPAISHPQSTFAANPNVTPYRIIVCSAVVALGLSKAMLGYANQSTAATWLDWAVAVPVTTILYILGLYEYNAAMIFPAFFTGDRSDILYTVNRGMMLILGISFASGWTVLWTYILYRFTVDPEYDFGVLPSGQPPRSLVEYVDSWQALSLKLWLQECFLAAIAIGCFLLLLLFKSVGDAVVYPLTVLWKRVRVVRRPVRALLRRIVLPSRINEELPVPTGESSIGPSRTSIKTLCKLAGYVVLQLSGAIFTLTMSSACTLSGLQLVLQRSWTDPVLILVLPMWVFMGLLFAWAAYNYCRLAMAANIIVVQGV